MERILFCAHRAKSDFLKQNSGYQHYAQAVTGPRGNVLWRMAARCVAGDAVAPRPVAFGSRLNRDVYLSLTISNYCPLPEATTSESNGCIARSAWAICGGWSWLRQAFGGSVPILNSMGFKKTALYVTGLFLAIGGPISCSRRPTCWQAGRRARLRPRQPRFPDRAQPTGLPTVPRHSRPAV